MITGAACAGEGPGVSEAPCAGALADEDATAMSAKIGQIERISERRDWRRAARAILGLLGALCLALTPLALGACHGAATGPRDPGGPFTLVDFNGRPVDQNLLKGKWTLVFFGYTFCPDYCPTTLTMLGRTMDQLGPDKAGKTQVLFITVDPDRDTPKQLKMYLSSPAFPKNAIGLTGTPAQIAQAAKAYYAVYQKDGTGPNYTVDHTTVIYLMNPDGRFVKPIAEGLTPDEVAGQISAAMRGA
jgi:protein SCO1/2